MDGFLQQLQSAIGHSYAIERELGGGGMSRVFVAREVTLDRRVVIKLLPPEMSAAVSVERFRREIRLAARLQHPHIVPVLAAGEAEGMLYYTMPLVAGESLRTRLSRGELPIGDAVRILREVADALCCAHEEGVVHRDLKPENVLLSSEHAQVSDFGVAKALTAASGTEAVTSTGVALGTPSYMAPEQIAADTQVDARADVYALGVLAYEMLAGHPPFAGPPAQLFAQHMTVEPPPLAPRRPNAPARLVTLVERCLEKRPADRPQSAREVLEALRSLEVSGATAATNAASMDTNAAGQSTAPPGKRGWRGSRRMATAGAVIAALILAAAAWVATRGDRSPVLAAASSLAILPFSSPSADSAMERLGRDLVVTVSTNLDGVAGVRVADPMTVLAQVMPGRGMVAETRSGVARVVGSRSVVHGTLVRQGELVRADLVVESVDSAGTEILGRGTVTAAADDVAALTDSVTWEVLRLVWRRGDLPTPSFVDLTTRSLDALKAYLEGEQLIVANDWQDAEQAFARAIGADSTFWMAHWRYNYARSWQLLPPNPESRAKVDSNLAAFAERDRLLIEANREDSLGTRTHQLGNLVTRYPDSWFIAMRWADLLTHDAPALGTTAGDAMRAWQQVLRLNPRLGPAYSHLATMAIREGDTALLRATVDSHRRYVEGPILVEGLREGGESFIEGMLEWHTGDSVAATEQLVRVVSQPGAAPAAGGVLFFSRQSPLITLLHPHLRTSAEGSAHAPGRLGIHFMGLLARATRGEWEAIHDSLLALQRELRRVEQAAGSASSERRGLIEELLAMAAWTGALDPQIARRNAVRLQSEMTTADERARLAWIEGLIAAATADRSALARARADIRAADGRLTTQLDEALRGIDLWLAGDQAAAARVLDSISAVRGRWSARRLSDLYTTFDVVLRLAAARATLARGDTAAALRHLAIFDVWAMSATSLPVDIFYPLADYERARIAQAQGRLEDARLRYERLLAVYTHPPPGHESMVNDAREQLARISGLSEPPASSP